MNNIKCLIVDDEPLAIDVIDHYLKRIQNVCITSCGNALEAFKLMGESDFDIIFLDIEMPVLNGLDFLKTISKPPAIIITTAYREYAVEGFDFEAIDYLLKPIPFPRFLKAFERAVKILKPAIPSEGKKQDEYIFLKTEKNHVKVFIDEILYIESLKDHIRLKTATSEWVSYQSLAAITDELPAERFLRIHRSFTIALNKVTSIKGSSVEIDGKLIPLSREQKEIALQKILNKK
ncbi:LytR/AlgR family response regulator transcription factor [Mucilaginibacter terrae]|uniref:LytR/AlgR family response regulator transcription factor n=1 Tax=Mucilaginibacter terrae TaxID=1955052 RepID=UPI0036311C3D